MNRLTFIALLLITAAGFGQSDYLDPAAYPNAMDCDTTGNIAVFEQLYRGTRTYKVGKTPIDPISPGRRFAPVIDGYLEDNVWFYAETLNVNSWTMAERGICQETNRRYTGPADLHAVWRFMYDSTALYLGCEVHDDIHDIDSLSPWTTDDALEISLSPWDWGDFTMGLWSAANIFRQFYDIYNQPISGGGIGADSSEFCFVRLIKRLNEEPFAAGWIRTKRLTNYTRGSEALNYVLGRADLRGIEFAVHYQGVDNFFRMVHHAEFKFPFHTGLWAELAGTGFFDSTGCPKSGNRFKMNLTHYDDDLLGPVNDAGASFLTTRRDGAPFWESGLFGDHWSSVKYFPTFQYVDSVYRGVHVDVNSAVEANARTRATGLNVSHYPNPANARTVITFALSAETASRYALDIFEINGKLFRHLSAGKAEGGLQKQIVWNGRDARGVPAANGVYLVRLQTARGTVTQRMLFMR